MSLGLPGPVALAAVTCEWLVLGWLSGVRFCQPGLAGSLASWPLRLLAGACLVAFAQLLLALTSVGFASVPVVLGVAALGALAVRSVGLRRIQHPAPETDLKQLPVERREVFGWLLLGGVLLSALVRAWVVPEAGWDAFSHWGLRAQAFADAGTLVNAHSEHEYYPPLVPLLEAWLYAHLGFVSIDLGKTVWAVVGGAFALCLAWHLRLSLRNAWQAPYLAAGIVLATPELLDGFWTGQADLPLTASLCLATLAVWQWLRRPERGWLVQAAIFGAAAALCKFEGLPRVGIVVAALVVEIWLIRRCPAWPPILTLAVAAAAAALVWVAFELKTGISPNGEHVGALQLQAVGSILAALFVVFAGVRTGGGLVVAGLGWVVAGRELVRPLLRLLTLVVIGQAAATLIAFLVSAAAPDVEVMTSATRLVAQFLPLALFVAAVGLSETGHL